MKKRTLAIAVATISIAAIAAPARAVAFDINTGAGFIARGDVISHPTLGKNALVQDPRITFSRNGAHYEQTCLKTTGTTQSKVFSQGLSSVRFTLDTRNAPGNSNISGYILNSAGAPSPTPTNICPTNWTPTNSVTLVGGRNTPPLLIFRADNQALQGGWYLDIATSTWLIWNG